MSSFPLTLGAVTFSELEVPQEIGPFGGKQVLVVREYPGGVREVDDIGAFPYTLAWSGIFTGADAFARAATVDRMRATAQEVTLTYGPQAFLGKVGHFKYNPRHQYLIPYQIEFEPILDLSGLSTVPTIGFSSEVLLGDETTATQDIIDGTDGLALPSVIAPSASLLLASVRAGLNNGNGTVAGIPPAYAAAIRVASAAVIASASPLISGTDPAAASPALDITARARAIALTVNNAPANTKQFRAINPNLFALAAQYYGDATKWQTIAAASNLSDPQPTGEFTIVVPLS